MSLFVPGEIYVRQTELHDQFGGQRYGGISTPHEHPLVLIFTGGSGEAYGYEDRYQPDGTFWYYGEGQVGDMKMDGGNRAIRDHHVNEKELHLFEKLESKRYRYVGEATYLGHHVDRAPDRNADLRDAFVFELEVTDPRLPVGTGIVREGSRPPRYHTIPMDELRRLAVETPPGEQTREERRRTVRVRSEAVKVYVLRRANGSCEGCAQPAPFKTKQRRPYLEPHHIRRIADGGPDHPRWVIALCPNCHRRVHYGEDGETFNRVLSDTMGALESEDLSTGDS